MVQFVDDFGARKPVKCVVISLSACLCPMIQRPASQGGASASQRLLPCVVMFCWHRASPLGEPTSYWKQNHFMF